MGKNLSYLLIVKLIEKASLILFSRQSFKLHTNELSYLLEYKMTSIMQSREWYNLNLNLN